MWPSRCASPCFPPCYPLTNPYVQISSKVHLDSRPEYHRVWLRPSVSPTGGLSLKAFSTGGQRSSRTVSLAGANGLLELPALEDEIGRAHV